MTSATTYVGTELDLFEHARNWKSYWRATIAKHIGGDVLEVGAGIGANTKLLADLNYTSWTALEPDPAIAARIGTWSHCHRTLTGTIQDLRDQFDTILYIDVLEHIEDDRAELIRAAMRLKPGGTLVVLAPAHPFLYTPFDAAIGHFRRYTRASLRAAAPDCLRCQRIFYLDSVGCLASAANRVLLKAAMPTLGQILTWDRCMVPISRMVDPLFAGRAGKSVVGIWRFEQ